jgi:hypothetical protein
MSPVAWQSLSAWEVVITGETIQTVSFRLVDKYADTLCHDYRATSSANIPKG